MKDPERNGVFVHIALVGKGTIHGDIDRCNLKIRIPIPFVTCFEDTQRNVCI